MPRGNLVMALPAAERVTALPVARREPAGAPAARSSQARPFRFSPARINRAAAAQPAPAPVDAAASAGSASRAAGAPQDVVFPAAEFEAPPSSPTEQQSSDEYEFRATPGAPPASLAAALAVPFADSARWKDGAPLPDEPLLSDELLELLDRFAAEAADDSREENESGDGPQADAIIGLNAGTVPGLIEAVASRIVRSEPAHHEDGTPVDGIASQTTAAVAGPIAETAAAPPPGLLVEWSQDALADEDDANAAPALDADRAAGAASRDLTAPGRGETTTHPASRTEPATVAEPAAVSLSAAPTVDEVADDVELAAPDNGGADSSLRGDSRVEIASTPALSSERAASEPRNAPGGRRAESAAAPFSARQDAAETSAAEDANQEESGAHDESAVVLDSSPRRPAHRPHPAGQIEAALDAAAGSFVAGDSDAPQFGPERTSVRTGGTDAAATLAHLPASNAQAAPAADAIEVPLANRLSAEDAARFADRLAQAIDSARQQDSRLRVRLHPPELGTIHIEVRLHEGELSARLEVQSAGAHRALTDTLPTLRESLAHTRTAVDRIDVRLVESQRQESSGRDFGDAPGSDAGDDEPGHNREGHHSGADDERPATDLDAADAGERRSDARAKRKFTGRSGMLGRIDVDL